MLISVPSFNVDDPPLALDTDPSIDNLTIGAVNGTTPSKLLLIALCQDKKFKQIVLIFVFFYPQLLYLPLAVATPFIGGTDPILGTDDFVVLLELID